MIIYSTYIKRIFSSILLTTMLLMNSTNYAAEIDSLPPPSYIKKQPLLCFGTVKHSMKFLSFLGHYVSPLYEFNTLEWQKEVFPITLFTQTLVYQADEEIEQGQKDSAAYTGVQPWITQKESLMKLLKEIDLYSLPVEQEADHLTEYWTLENDLMSGGVITPEKLKKAIELRASDVMMLHHIYENIRGIFFEEKAWEAIQIIEAIRDVEDDVRSYEKDIANDDFNIYRMFVKFYGNEGQEHLQNKLNQLWDAYYEIITNLPIVLKNKFITLTERYHEQRPRVSVPSAKIETL